MVSTMKERDSLGRFLKGGNLGHAQLGGFTTMFKKGHPDFVPKEKRGHSDVTKLKISLGGKGKHSGPLAWNWKEDRTLLSKGDEYRNSPAHREWSRAVKNRDGWKCKISNGSCSGRVVAHHILSWREFAELRYEVNNGITLCHFHHPRKRKDEMILSPFFQRLVGVKET